MGHGGPSIGSASLPRWKARLPDGARAVCGLASSLMQGNLCVKGLSLCPLDRPPQTGILSKQKLLNGP